MIGRRCLFEFMSGRVTNRQQKLESLAMKIAHIADIHVQDRRRQEYREVFVALCADLEKSGVDAIAVAGDVFHTMTRASAANWDDVATFLRDLSRIAPVALIPGNHDMNVRGESSNLLAPLFQSAGGARELDLTRIQFWEQSGIYQHPLTPDILWCVGTPVGELPTPQALQQALGSCAVPPKAVVAMFHETIHGCRYANGMEAEAERLTPAYLEALTAGLPIPCGVMLGDVHLLQIIPTQSPVATVAYSGSLICQNLGEPHVGHGWLEWNLSVCPPAVVHHEISNKYAPYTAEIKSGRDETVEPRPENPAVWRLRADAATTSADIGAHVAALTTRHGRAPRDVIVETAPSPQVGELADQVISPENHIPQDYLESQEAEAWLRADKTDPDIAREVLSRFENDLSTLNPPQAARMTLKRLEFSDMYCYGPGNVLDFEKMKKGQPGLIGLSAPNASGKSSLFDILYIAMAGAPMRGHKSNALREGADRYDLTLVFELDGREGRVTAWRKHHTQLLKFEYDGQDLTGKDASETLKVMAEHFGQPKHISQVVLYRPAARPDFFVLSHVEQDHIIADLLALAHIAEIRKRLDNEYTKTRATVKALAQVLEVTLPGVTQPKQTQAQKTQALITHIKQAQITYNEMVAAHPRVVQAIEASENSVLSAEVALQEATAYLRPFALVEHALMQESHEEPEGINIIAGCQELVSLLQTANADEMFVPRDHPPPAVSSEQVEVASARALAARGQAETAQSRVETAGGAPDKEYTSNEFKILELAAAGARGVPVAVIAEDLHKVRSELAGTEAAGQPGGRKPADLQAELDKHTQEMQMYGGVVVCLDEVASAHAYLTSSTTNSEKELIKEVLQLADPVVASISLGELLNSLAQCPLDGEPSDQTVEELAKESWVADSQRTQAMVEARALGERPSDPLGAEPPEEERPHPVARPSASKPTHPPARSSETLEMLRFKAQRSPSAAFYLQNCSFEAGCDSCQKLHRLLGSDAAEPATCDEEVESARADERLLREHTRYEQELEKYTDSLARYESHQQWIRTKKLYDAWNRVLDAETTATQLKRKYNTARRRDLLRQLVSQYRRTKKAEAVQAKIQLLSAELAAARSAAGRASLEVRMQELQAAEYAERAQIQLMRYRAQVTWRAQMAAAQEATNVASQAAAAYDNHQQYQAEKGKAIRNARRRELVNKLSACRAQAAQKVDEVQARYAEAKSQQAAIRAYWSKYEAECQRVYHIASQHVNVAQLEVGQAQVAQIAKYRELLDPATGLLPRIVGRARSEFVAAVNRRLASASCDFQLIAAKEGFELKHATAGRPSSRDPSLASGYQSFVLELSARASLAELARVPLPSLLLVDEGFGCLDAANAGAVSECLRTLSVDPMPGRPLLLY